MEISYIAAFAVGFLGGVHCVGMCGGIVGALSFGLPEEKRMRVRHNLPFLLLYNLGRLSSYVLAGAIVGGLGALTFDLLIVRQAQLYLQLIRIYESQGKLSYAVRVARQLAARYPDEPVFQQQLEQLEAVSAGNP